MRSPRWAFFVILLSMKEKHIIAGSAGFQHKDGRVSLGPTLRYVFDLTKKSRPSICYIKTADGDSPQSIVAFYNAGSNEEVNTSHLQLFPFPNHSDVEEHLLSQDVIWVGGGSVANLLAVWKIHGLDTILRKAWEQGIILGGISAGSICWNVGGTTDSFGTNLQPITDGLGFLPYSSGVHYDSEEKRRPLFQKLIEDDILPDGYATDDGVSLHFVNIKLHKAITDTPDRFAYHVYKNDKGKVVEEKITPQLLFKS